MAIRAQAATVRCVNGMRTRAHLDWQQSRLMPRRVSDRKTRTCVRRTGEMTKLSRNGAGRARLHIWAGWLLAGSVACAVPCAPLRAAPAPPDVRCAGARAWTTQSLPSGGLRSAWESPDCTAHDRRDSAVVVNIDASAHKQRMLGFGAALTGSAAWLMTARMSEAQRTDLIRSLFAPAPEGIGLSLLRLPIGSTDLSRRRYSLAPTAPATATDPVRLDLAPMRRATLPILHDILKVNPDLRIIASSWSAPAWMKTSGSLMGGQLQPEREAQFAQYLADFVQTMRASGIPVFAVTLQNEPGYLPADYPGMQMDSPQRTRIVAHALGPLLARAHPDTTIFEWDDNWDRFKQPMQVLADTEASRYLSGIAWHCYIGRPNVQDLVHAQHPDKWQLVTECSDGTWSPNSRESIADFADRVMIEPARHWGAGTILWSLALDEQHGPHDGGCGRCIGVVTINQGGQAEPTRDYYVLGHFSAFVPPGAYRIDTNANADTLGNLGFISADGRTLTLVLANRSPADRRVRVELNGQDVGMAITARAQSLTTVQFRVPTWLAASIR